MKRKGRPNVYLIGGVLLIILAYPLYLFSQYLIGITNPETTEGPKTETVTKQAKAPKPKEELTPIPATTSLTVPYTVQAPYANWAVHEESCEEAALLMAERYLAGQKTDIGAAVADREFRKMKAWQRTHYGSEPDLSMAALGRFGENYYGLRPRLIAPLTADAIKTEIAAGRPVLVPVMTQSLKNPHYSPGDVYHVLLIKGYDKTGVITNDAGVKEGKNWHYSWEVLFAAIDAQTAKMKQGRIGLVYTR